jgi:hypothetical protein
MKTESTDLQSSPMDFVEDDEVLFRSVLEEYFTNGKLSSQAFTDRDRECSVDRAKLNGNNPKRTQLKPTDFVFSIITGEVRSIELKSRPPNALEIIHTVQVLPKPLEATDVYEANEAHAVIKATPEVGSKAERRLREALALIASMVLQPEKS